jgi:hypothetical protein
VGRGSGRRSQRAGLELREVWAAVPEARRRVAVYWLAVMARRSEAAQHQTTATGWRCYPGGVVKPWSR